MNWDSIRQSQLFIINDSTLYDKYTTLYLCFCELFLDVHEILCIFQIVLERWFDGGSFWSEWISSDWWFWTKFVNLGVFFKIGK